MIYFYLNPIDLESETDWHRVVPWGTDENTQPVPLTKDQSDLFNFVKTAPPNTLIHYITNPRGVLMRVTKEDIMQLAGTPASVLRQQMESFQIN